MKCGIIGLPNVGKTALFNLLTANQAASSNYPYCTIEPNHGVAVFRDERLDKLAGLFPDAKVTHPHIEFIDVAGLPPGASKGEGLGNQFLSNIRNAYCLLHVVRGFTSDHVSRFDNSSSAPKNDVELVETELFLADLEIAQRRLKENPESEYWNKAAQDLKESIVPQKDEEGVLLTPKPAIVVVNISTGMEKPDVDRDKVIYIDVEFQRELTQMEEGERVVFIKDMPQWESNSDNIMGEVKRLLDQVTFFTIVGGKEVKGYNIKKGATAYEAAGKIHTDIQQGFIRAKVYSFRELEDVDFDVETLKKQGKVRTEGRDYQVQDGDVMEILFS